MVTLQFMLVFDIRNCFDFQAYKIKELAPVEGLQVQECKDVADCELSRVKYHFIIGIMGIIGHDGA